MSLIVYWFVLNRKLSRKFPVDTKWLKVSYFFSAFYHFIVGSKAREESTRSFGVDKTAWDAFQKILAVALRSRQIFYEWIAKLLIPSNMSQHNFWKDFFAVDANVTAWKVYLERYRDPYLKVILPSSTTATSKSKDTGGSGGLIEVDLETLRRNDRDVCFVYKTIQEYLDLVVREGEQYLQILTNKLSGNNSGNPTMIHLPPTQAFLRTSINYQSYYEALTWSQDYDKLYFYNLSNPSSKGPTQHGGSLLSYVFPSCTDSPMSPTTRLTEELIINLQQLSQTNELVTKLPVPAMSKEISKFALNGAEDHSMIHSMFYKCRDITYREYFEQGLLELIEHNEAVGYQSYDLLAYVLPLCALQCYRAATKILQLLSHVNSSASASKDAASTKFKSVDAFLQANHAMIPMHVLYFYMPYDVKLHTLEQTVKQSIDVLSSSHHAFEHQCFENDEAMKILEVTPLTLAIFHQQPDFIALFLEVFPIFNFDINALFMLTMELQLFDAFAGLLSHLTCFKCEAILPFSHHAPYHIMSKEENNKYTQEGLDLYSNPHLQLPHGRYSHEYKHKYQLANRNFCLQSIQYLHQLIQSQQEAGSMPQAYAYLDMRLVCSYVLESTHTSPSGSLRSLDAKRVVLMDGTILPVAMVIDNVYNLFRALPQPCLRPGYTRALQTTLLHLAAQHSDLDFISRLLKNSSSTAPSGTSQSKQWWMIFIEVSDRVGKTPLTYLMEAGHYSFVQELLLRYSEQDSSVSSSLAATSGMAVTKNSCLYPQLHDLDHLAMVWNHAKLQDLQATQHRLQIPDEAGAQIDSNKQYLHSFASLLRAQPRAIQINSSLMKLSICLQYSQYLWNTIIVQRDFMRFVQYSVSSSFWSKMDSMVRARQVLSLLNIPFSYLTNTTTKKEAMFDFHPTALYQRIPVALYQQLKILLSGWFRMRCLSSKSTSTAASNSRQHCNTMLLEDCLFQHHVETSNCVSFGMSGLSIDDYLHVMTTTNKAKKTTKGSSAHPTAQVADIIKLEMLSNRENTPIASSSNMFSNNIVDTASKSFDIIYDALQSAYLILEFARSIVQCRTLAIVTYEAKGIAGATRSSDASKGIVANKAESSNPSQYVQIRYADHPLQHQHNQYLHYQQQLTYLQQRVQGSISSESNQGDMKKGLQQRMLFCDFIKIPELKTFLTLPTCYSCICSSSSSSSSHDSNNTSKNRLSIIRDLVMDGLINLLYDVDQASYGELICRLHLLSSSTTSTTGTGTSGGNTALAEMLLQPNSSTTANGTLGHKGARLSDSEDVLTSLLTLLQSFTIADFWCCTNSKGTKSGSAEEKRFPHFMSKFGASSIKQGGNLLISMIQSLKKGDVLTIAAEEETYLNKLFRDQATGNTTAAGNMTMKLTPQRREQMLQDTMQALSTAYKLCSYFYWMLTSIYGLIHHSTSSEEVMASGHLPLYSSTLYDEDVACGKSQALHPLLLLSTPVLKFWTRDNTLTKVHHNRQRQHHMFHVQRKLAMQSILKLRHNPNIYPNKAIVKQALDIAILSGDYMFANELLAGKQVKDLLSDVSIHFKYLLLAALLQCPSYTFLHKTGKEESYHKRVTCIQCVQLLLDHHFPTAFPDTSVAPMMSTVWCFLIAAWKNMPMDVLDRLWIRVVKEAERQNDQSEIVARFLMVALALISVNHHVQDRVLSKPSHTTTSRSYVKQEERQQLIKRIVEFIHQCGHKSIRTSVGSVLTYSLAHMTLLQSLQSQLQQLVCGVFAHLEQHQITGINANDLVLDLKQDLKAAIETCLTLSLPSRPVIGNLTYEVVNVATDSPTQKILTKHLLSTFLCPIQYDLLQLLLALNSTAKSRDSSMPSMDVSESMWSMLDLCIVLKDSTSLLTNLHHTFPFDKMKVVIQFLFASNEEQPRQDDDDDNNAVSLEAVNALQRLIAQCIIYQELSCLKAIHQFILSFGKASNTSVKITSSMAEELWSYLLHTELTLHKVGFNASNAFSVTMNILDFLLINTNPQSLHIATYLLDSGLNVTSMNFVKMICGNQVLHRNEEDHRGLNIASEATIVFFLNYYLKKKSSDEVNQLREELAFTTSLYDRDSGIDYLENHDTLLHILCRKGYSKLVRVWCEEIMIDLYRNPQIKPILMRQSSSSQHIDASALLGRNQVNILELKNDLDEDPLQVSITWGHSEVTKTLKSYCPPNIFKAIAYMRYLMHLVLLNRKKLKGKLEVVRKKQQEEEEAKQAKEEFRIRGEGEDEDEEYLEQRNKYLYGSFNDGNDEDNDD